MQVSVAFALVRLQYEVDIYMQFYSFSVVHNYCARYVTHNLVLELINGHAFTYSVHHIQKYL